MKLQKKHAIILAVVLLVVLALSLLLTNQKVRAMYGNAYKIFVLYRVENELLMGTPAGRYYRTFFWKSNDELIRIYYAYPEKSNDMFTVIDMYMPALEALLDGRGDTVTLSAEQVDAAQAEFEWLESVAESPLREDIQGELERFPMQTFTGMTAKQAWDYINANWVPRTPEEQAMSEMMTKSPPTPDYQATKLDYAVEGEVGFFYPSGWTLSASDPGADPVGRTVFIDPPGVDSSGSPSVDRITMQIWSLAADQQDTLDPARSDPADDGYAVLWQETQQLGDLHGARYVWGQPGGDSILYARLYGETEQIAIQLSAKIKNPDDLRVFGFRYTLGTEYAPFNSILYNIQVVGLPTETPQPTLTPFPTETPIPVLPTGTGTFFVTETPTP
ncbi:MAG TPA: hypothetical protein VMC09_07310 [Anaerolineales bacterium]|nr:hypothetical protein [Anaerolineales bacterium]